MEDGILCYFDGNELKEMPKFSTEIFFDTEEERYRFEQKMENMDKYRWHDLRKNPEDLPKFDKNKRIMDYVSDPIIIYVFDNKMHEYLYVSCTYYEADCDVIGEFISDANDSNEIEGIYKTDKVIAWKYIEPFEP